MNKDMTHDYDNIDINRVVGWFMFSDSNPIQVELTYNTIKIAQTRSGAALDLSWLHNGAKMDQVMRLASSDCYYGGTRPWFQCPDCEARVGKLYLKGHFACRSCHDLMYQSQYQSTVSEYAKLTQQLLLTRDAIQLAESIKTPYYRGRETRKLRALKKKLTTLKYE